MARTEGERGSTKIGNLLSGSMRPLAEAAARIAGQSFSRKFVALGRIASQWNEIVGSDLAAIAHPVRIHTRKLAVRGTPDVILDIAVAPAQATLLHYQKDLILARINQIFGAGWVTQIRFVPPADAGVKPKSWFKKPTRMQKNLTEDEKNTLYNMLETVQDDDLRERLGRLGQSILLEEKQ